ncbi:MAG: triose-phosphate isomerase, partial [Patescibacteria group bacterium]|nr:triose-phosphate isomerase [Patescibacteria group bacterium]
NWKMNPVMLKEVKQLFNLVKKGIKNIRGTEVVICPPFPYLLAIKPYSHKVIKLGAQDCFWEERGAFTGEVSPAMLKDVGVEYVIIGHSERRRYFNETDEMINKKLKAALKMGLKPILCVGDKSRESKEDIEEIRTQLEKDLSNLKKINLENLVIAYEPIWAISTTPGGAVATPKETMEGTFYIKKILNKLLGKSSARKIKILYGGSVNSKNVREFIYEARMNGVLVGASSLNSKEFIELIKNVSKG